MTDRKDRREDEVSRSLRRRAEKHLRLTRQSVEAMSPRDVQEIVYELQVHQIELEMQNEALAQAQADTELARQKYQQLYDLAPIGYLTVGADDIIMEANAMAGRLLGRPHFELPGQAFSGFLTSDSRDVFNLHRRSVFRTHERQDCQIQTAAEPPIYLHVHSHADIGNEDNCRVVVSDITMMKKLEARLQRLAEEAQAANVAKSQFMANMSHELRTPLNAVIGLGSLMQMTPLDREQTQFVSTIMASGQNLLELINDLLDFAKLESNAVAFESLPFNLKNLLHEVQRMSAVIANEKGLGLLVEYPDALPTVFVGDPHRIRQVVVNLVSNAIKFTPRGDVSVRVSGYEGDTNTYQLDIAVIDSGIGIPLDKRDAIFDSFTQADASMTRRFGGTGLGLTICRQLVQLMGGAITVEDNPGGGSVFRVSLSLPLATSGQISLGDTAAFPVPELTTGSHGRILLVEDQPVNVLVATGYLQRLGCEIDICTSGREAVTKCEDERYALILMDVEMPEMDGHETTRAIRSREKSTGKAPAPIVALTAHASPDDRQKCLDSGMDDYISKPFAPADLQRCITRFIKTNAE